MTTTDSDRENAEPAIAGSVGDQLRHWRSLRQVSQLDLAADADTSSRHLSFIETGRAHPSRELLIQLMQVLEIPLRTQNTILINAGYAPSFEKTGLTRPEMEQLAVMLGHMVTIMEPYPAMLIDRNWDIIECNKAFIRLCETFVDDASLLDLRPMNLLKLFLDVRAVGHAVVNLPDVYATMVNRAKRMINLTGESERSSELLEKLLENRPEGPTSMDQSMPHLLMPVRLKKGKQQVNMLTMVSTMGAPLNVTLQEIYLEFGLPMDDEAKHFFEALAS